ncbi:hypothetical protein A2625_00780 [candidate division WOR-1 bacterium RIFCSPHIGHO2_01_FULL_53_15]|uniref:siroheme decarboxylase n=1 Tax=candidate division WOR-1 bacterium RIFCSPHIGHO2_01_FULL_53_15 TaxID=1802564 RepID=A0A1F4Q3E3_UNCSA|nr:MAG: hypothetical protein A2625_00780 [candidate division WOR-1 bacterium RIFCSPHIGHO2_01_FULL_53_15]OGC12699.1 MAG: hypothetical protein A3D23_03045 [candidate division WOR-1 bacterium RIFCSPHIGHO2_02_FULL_53_26]
MDATDKKLLNELQFNFPIDERPYLEIAERIGLSEAETIERIKVLKESNVIRRIGPTFEGSKLGYVNTLVAMKIPPKKLDEIGALVSRYDEVTHNYAREHEYNLWFTLTCENKARLDQIASEIKTKSGIGEIYLLPMTKKFKINARFEL